MSAIKSLTLEQVLETFVDYAEHIGVSITEQDTQANIFEEIKNFIPKFVAYHNEHYFEVEFIPLTVVYGITFTELKEL